MSMLSSMSAHKSGAITTGHGNEVTLIQQFISTTTDMFQDMFSRGQKATKNSQNVILLLSRLAKSNYF